MEHLDRKDRTAALERAHAHALAWLDSLGDRPVPPRLGVDAMAARLDRELPDGPTDAAAVVDELVAACDPGLTAMPGGRFFGFVIGGTHPAALAADWLVSAWDQNSGLRTLTPAHSAVEDLAEEWLVDLLGLPPGSAVGFVTGGTMANFTCLAAGRDEVLRRHGWDVAERGLAGSPGVRVVVGAERHDTIDLSLRYLGLGAPEPVAVDDQGRLDPSALADALSGADGRPMLVALQAGNVHSGAFDPFEEAIGIAHEAGAWVHVDGAFGLFAAASPARRHLVAGLDRADSWATDAHKTLNVPYDCGLAIVRDRAALKAAMGMHGDYLIHDAAGEPFDKVPEISRRGRAFPVWAVLRALGRLRRGHRGARGGGGAQRRGLHPGVCGVRRQRPHPVGGRGDARRRHRLDDRLAVARPGGAPGEREQLVHEHRRRRSQPGRAAAGGRSIGSQGAHLSIHHGRRAHVRRPRRRAGRAGPTRG
jgi:hypothetical protein